MERHTAVGADNEVEQVRGGHHVGVAGHEVSGRVPQGGDGLAPLYYRQRESVLHLAAASPTA